MGDLAVTGDKGSTHATIAEFAASGEAVARAPMRDQFNRWFITHEVAWELAMAALAIVYVALGFVADDLTVERPEISIAE